MDEQALLCIKDLSVSFTTDNGSIEVLDRVSISIQQGKVLSLVGESGCGKSVTASSIMQILPYPYGQITHGSIYFNGSDLLTFPIEEMYKIRGSDIAMIFQEPMTALNPVQVVEKQIGEVFRLHRPDVTSKEELRSLVLKYLKDVEMPSPEQRMHNYPFQLSGGMRQRVMIAMALAGEPKLLIADEPTTALDVTVQAQIIALIKDLQVKNNMGVLYITHDMGVVAEISDEVAVMYAGQIIESGDVKTIFKTPRHPYTRGLIASMPSLRSVPKTKLPCIPGNVPTPHAYPETCRFAQRCTFACEKCTSQTPVLEEIEKDHFVRCIKAKELA